VYKCLEISGIRLEIFKITVLTKISVNFEIRSEIFQIWREIPEILENLREIPGLSLENLKSRPKISKNGLKSMKPFL